jgi:hypothetical protein
MRDDQLARLLDLGRSGTNSFPPDTSYEMFIRGDPPTTGQDVAGRYGLLAHYTSLDRLVLIHECGGLYPGTWLTPTAYASCMAPYNLGLNTPRDVCLLIDVSGIQALWGPGRARSSATAPNIWQGRGIEFYCPSRIDWDSIRRRLPVWPCGDRHP